MPECYVQPMTDRQICFQCHKTVTGKRKLSKCSKCHAITYCGRECQVADWPRHAWNCIPVMVTKIPGKGRGLVAARDIKMGEFIFLDKPAITLPNHSPIEYDEGLSEEEYDSIVEQVQNLSSEAKLLFFKLEERRKGIDECGCLSNTKLRILRIFSKNASGDHENMALFLNCALLNHSCAPNAAPGPTEDQNNEVRAIKDISKGEEVTVFYRWFNGTSYKKLGCERKERMEVIKDSLGFDCNCCVCAGNVPIQDEITKELLKLEEGMDRMEGKVKRSYLVNTVDKIVDLRLQLTVGHIEDKISAIEMLARLGYTIRDEERIEKAKRELKKLAADTQLEYVMKRYEDIDINCQYDE